MTGPRPLPAPGDQCVFGWIVLVASWFVTAVTAFALTASVLRRRWQLTRGDTR